MEPSTIIEQIQRILGSQSFATKSQLRKLLEVLSKNMDSQTALTPELVIKELWPDEIRTKRAADVATEMNRLRHALETYYEQEGKTDPIKISLPNRAARTADGTHEKRWIVATSCEGPQHEATADRVPTMQVALHPGLKKFVFVAGLAAVLGIVAYVSFVMLSADDQPRLGRLEGSSLVIMNAEGKELWRKAFPEGFGPDWYRKTRPILIWFGNLEGKGHTSVLFVYTPAGPLTLKQSSTLICYSDRGREKWHWTPGRELPELAGSAPTFLTFALEVLKATSQKPPRIVVSSEYNPWWANQVALLDPSGRTISEYWHSGTLTDMTLADLDGSGREEIIAAGVANGYDHQATLVVLDPDRVSGASTEVRPEFQIHGMGVAQERLRLLFPRSDLNRALFQYNQAIEPVVEHGNLRLTVMECISPPGCHIWYEFDKNFHLIAAYAGGDEFRSAHERFYQNGKNAHTLSPEEQAAFLRVRCLVGCKSQFVPVGKLVP